jgi:hypothetical protein
LHFILAWPDFGLSDINIFMQPFRFLLYCVSLIAGIAGLVIGGCPVIAEVFYELFPRSRTIDNAALYRSSVISLLSLILLILVHLGNRLAGAFDVGSPKKPEPTKPPSDLEV